jgi:hypothetical protein
MPRPFNKKKTARDRLESRLDDLASQTEELRQQVVDRAPGVRDQLIDMLPDKDQLRELRDDLFERLPDNVAEKLPEKVKPKKRSKLRRMAFLGMLTGAGAAAFAVMKGRKHTPPPPPEPFRPPTATPAADVTPPPTKETPTKKP